MRQSAQAIRRTVLAACVGGLVAPGLVPTATGAEGAPPPAPAVPAGTTVTVPPPPVQEHGRALVMTGISLEIVGAAALLTGGVFSYLVHKTTSDADSLTSGGKVAQGTDLRTKQADGHRFVTSQWVFYGIGGIAAATGITLHIIGTRKNSGRAMAELQPVLSPSAWGFSLSVRL